MVRRAQQATCLFPTQVLPALRLSETLYFEGHEMGDISVVDDGERKEINIKYLLCNSHYTQIPHRVSYYIAHFADEKTELQRTYLP